MKNNQSQPQLKVAIVHDWLVGGGAELVVLELHKMYPDAPIYTSYCTDEWRKRLDNRVVTGWLQNWPFSRLRKYLPLLRIWWFTHLDFAEYDLVISSSGNGEAKSIKVPKTTTHICYCHTPTHFYWRHYDQYLAHPGFGVFDPLARIGLRMMVAPLRKWDRKAAQRPDFFIANSTHIQKDIQTYYHRDSVVIHPPVDTTRFSNPKPQIHAPKRTGFITVGRQVPYKKIDLIVAACTKLGLRLTVIGRGPDHDKLIKLAGAKVQFVTNASDKQVTEAMSKSQAFITAAFDDFGITPVEAMAAGTPVIAYRAGGALDYVVENKTGLFFDAQTTESLAAVLSGFDALKFDEEAIKEHAKSFDRMSFHKKLAAFITKTMS